MTINIPIIRPAIDNEFSENKLMCFYLKHTDGSTGKMIIRGSLNWRPEKKYYAFRNMSSNYYRQIFSSLFGYKCKYKVIISLQNFILNIKLKIYSLLMF